MKTKNAKTLFFMNFPHRATILFENAPFTLDNFKIFKMHSQCNFSKNVGGIKVVSAFVLALLSILFFVCSHTNTNQVQNELGDQLTLV